jgi:serine/threonine-protein phosphatase 6 regulatory ankyrin repeat subunit B
MDANIHLANYNGATPIIAASECGYKSIIEKLIDKGADINAKDGDGKTAMQKAIEYGHNDIVDFLKAKGAKE